MAFDRPDARRRALILLILELRLLAMRLADGELVIAAGPGPFEAVEAGVLAVYGEDVLAALREAIRRLEAGIAGEGQEIEVATPSSEFTPAGGLGAGRGGQGGGAEGKPLRTFGGRIITYDEMMGYIVHAVIMPGVMH